jgi:hypothetical protein
VDDVQNDLQGLRMNMWRPGAYNNINKELASVIKEVKLLREPQSTVKTFNFYFHTKLMKQAPSFGEVVTLLSTLILTFTSSLDCHSRCRLYHMLGAIEKSVPSNKMELCYCYLDTGNSGFLLPLGCCH